jgi:cytochrome c oxidase subunit III
MSQAAVQPSVAHTGIGMPISKLGMWLFLVSEIMFFTGLIGSYIVLRLGSEQWPNPGDILNINLLALNTFILITSSVTMALGLEAIQRDKVFLMRRYMLASGLLGSLFLLIKGWDYHHMWIHGFTLSSSVFGSCYYMLTGFHAVHVFSGLVLFAYLWCAAGRGAFSRHAYGRVEAVGLYWHFVDLVWVVLFAILCLV